MTESEKSVMQQALDALLWNKDYLPNGYPTTLSNNAIDALITAIAQPVEPVEPVARLEGVDEYGPRLEWLTHWVNVPVGANLYTVPQPVETASDRNFCPRCGKRLGGTDDIHTCTPVVQS